MLFFLGDSSTTDPTSDPPETTTGGMYQATIKINLGGYSTKNIYMYYDTSFCYVHPVLECIDARPPTQCKYYADRYCQQSCHRCSTTGSKRTQII